MKPSTISATATTLASALALSTDSYQPTPTALVQSSPSNFQTTFLIATRSDDARSTQAFGRPDDPHWEESQSNPGSPLKYIALALAGSVVAAAAVRGIALCLSADRDKGIDQEKVVKDDTTNSDVGWDSGIGPSTRDSLQGATKAQT